MEDLILFFPTRDHFQLFFVVVFIGFCLFVVIFVATSSTVHFHINVVNLL